MPSVNLHERYLALKVASDLPLRYRLVAPAKPTDRTDAAVIPKQIVVLLKSVHPWRPVVSLSCGGLINRLVVDAVGIEVEQPEDLYGRTCV
jgi:hypothetical protein